MLCSMNHCDQLAAGVCDFHVYLCYTSSQWESSEETETEKDATFNTEGRMMQEKLFNSSPLTQVTNVNEY